MNGSDVELRKELWMWRGVTIIILLIALITNLITFFVDRDQHAKDNQERAAAWQMLYGKADRNKDLIQRNAESVSKLEEHLRQCSGCHSHPNVKMKP